MEDLPPLPVLAATAAVCALAGLWCFARCCGGTRAPQRHRRLSAREDGGRRGRGAESASASAGGREGAGGGAGGATPSSCRVLDDLSDDALSDFADVLGHNGGPRKSSGFEWDSGDAPAKPTSLRL